MFNLINTKRILKIFKKSVNLFLLLKTLLIREKRKNRILNSYFYL